MVDSGMRHSIEHGALGSSQSPARWVVIGILSATTALGGLVPRDRSQAEDAKPGDGVPLSGRVLDRATGRPVEGAEIVLERSIRGADPRTLPPWVGETAMRTDADGRFHFVLTPEQTAAPRLCIAMRIRHPDFVRRKSRRVPFGDIAHGRKHGDEPFFATIPLERGVEYTAQVVVPGGKPAAGIPYAFELAMTETILPTPIFSDDEEGETDDEGRIRIRLPKARGLALYVGPPRTARARFPFAPYQHFWGTDHGAQHPEVWAPTDLGRIELSRGIRLSGRMVDMEGRPIAGQTVNAYAMKGRDRHSTTSETDGTFSLGPLRAANYLIYGEGQSPYFDVDLDVPPSPRPIRVVRPVGVYLKEGMIPEPVVLRELPTVRVEVRFVDSKGNAVRGSATLLSGQLPQDQGRPLFFPFRPRGGPTSAINGPEPQDVRDPHFWNVQEQPDEGGRVAFRAPLGLRNASALAPAPEDVTAYKHRLDPASPPLPGPGVRMGVLEGDRLVTLIAYRAPTVLISVRTEDGRVPTDLSINARYRLNRTNHSSLFIRQPDGRYRSQSLMPDHEYQVTVRDRGGGYELPPLQRVSLPEGGSAELSFLLRRPRKPPEAGQPAPPVAVKTIDGRTLSLASLRGKTVLIHFWFMDARAPDFASLKAVHDRFGKDERLAMIGLCLSDDSQRASSVIRSNGVTWSQAMLADGWYDRTVVAYGASRDRSYLIGPDGTLVARDLDGVAIEKAVADALAGKSGGSGTP